MVLPDQKKKKKKLAKRCLSETGTQETTDVSKKKTQKEMHRVSDWFPFVPWESGCWISVCEIASAKFLQHAVSGGSKVIILSKTFSGTWAGLMDRGQYLSRLFM